ncbi:IS1-like element transposase [Escherichia coli]|uniref:IS1-like element transposase n=1 Tax=Escherichia coli TaxID=562 RepID=UPI003DA5B051
MLQWLCFYQPSLLFSYYDGVVQRNGKAPPDISAISALTAVKHAQLQFTYTASQPGTHQKIIDMAMNGVGCRGNSPALWRWPQHDFTSLKNSGRSR